VVAALFIDPQGPYPALLGAENCWDEERDARTFAGPGPIVAHPPCGRWCAMAKLNERRWGAKVGDDGGCFAFALRALRFGGVLEHPAFSLAWPAFNLPRPPKRGWAQILPNVWVCEVWQSAYAHVATKRTWLLYLGRRAPFELRWERPRGTKQIGGGVNTGNRNLPRCTEEEAIHSPLAFAETLISLAAWSAT
jgi:hypothetical protein